MKRLGPGVLFLGLFACLTVLLYGPTLWYDYTYMDDHQLILKNWQRLSDFSRLGEAFLNDVFFNEEDAYYRPLLVVSFMLDAQLGGPDLFYFHLCNLLLHIICCGLIYLLLKRFDHSALNSGLLAAVFCVHPMLAQAVAWVPGRNDVLLALFVLISFHFLLSFARERKWYYWAGHLLFFTAALFTKETIVLFLGVCLSGLILIKRRRLAVMDWIVLGPGWLLACVIYWMVRAQAMDHPVSIDYLYLLKSFIGGLPGLLQYLGKMVLPVHLSVLPVIPDTGFLWPAAGVSLIGALIFRRWHKLERRFFVFSCIWILLFLAPALLRPNPGIMINFLEHRTYIPMVGLLILIGQMRLLPDRFSSRHYAVIVLLLLFAARTGEHHGAFQDKQHFWENAARTSPHAGLAQFNLGVIYYDLGDKNRAEMQFQKSHQIDPADIPSILNLGTLAMERGAYVEAEARMLAALRLNSTNGYAYSQLAELYAKMGRMEAAQRAQANAKAFGYLTP